MPILEIFLDEDCGVISHDAVILDLGANIGAFTIYATITTQGVHVYAFEPFLAFCDLLREDVLLNQQTGAVQCFNCAVASVVGTRELYMKGGDFFFPTLVSPTSKETQEYVTVPPTTLVEIMESNRLERVDLLKIDCEGAEYQILYPTPLSCLKKIAEIRMEYHNVDSGERHVEGLKRFFTRSDFMVTHLKPVFGANGTLWAERQPLISGTRVSNDGCKRLQRKRV